MKNLFIYIFIVTLISCQSDEIIDNQPQIDKIDALRFSEIIYGTSLNKLKNTMDTVSIEKMKYNSNGDLLYFIIELINNENTTTIEHYYRDNKDLFLKKFNTGTLNMSFVYVTYVNSDSVIIKSEMSVNEDGEKTTFPMVYNYDYDLFGKKKSLVVESEVDSIKSMSFEKYNEFEKKEYHYQIINNDTTESSFVEYQNQKISKYTYNYLRNKKIIISEYDGDKNIVSENTYKIENTDTILVEKNIFIRDSLGDLTGEEEYNLTDNTSKIIFYHTVKI